MVSVAGGGTGFIAKDLRMVGPRRISLWILGGGNSWVWELVCISRETSIGWSNHGVREERRRFFIHDERTRTERWC